MTGGKMKPKKCGNPACWKSINRGKKYFAVKSVVSFCADGKFIPSAFKFGGEFCGEKCAVESFCAALSDAQDQEKIGEVLLRRKKMVGVVVF